MTETMSWVRRETCTNCGNERDESKSCCGSCGFTWEQIDQAERIVHHVARAIGATPVDGARLRAAMDAVLGETVDPEI